MWLIAVLVACPLAVGAWFLYRESTPDWSENALGEIFGAEHPWSGNMMRPFLVEDDHADTLLGLVLRKDAAVAPAYVVLIKKPNPDPARQGISSRSGRASMDEDFKFTSHVGWSYPAGNSLSIEYDQSLQPFAERFAIDGQTYDLASGRVFLVDPAMPPHKVVQVNADVREVIHGQKWHRQQRAAAKKAVELLRAQHSSVNDFLGAAAS
jgi:hypothetical protein